MWGCREGDAGLSPAPTPPIMPLGTVGKCSPSHRDSAEHSRVRGTVPRAQLSMLTLHPLTPAVADPAGPTLYEKGPKFRTCQNLRVT